MVVRMVDVDIVMKGPDEHVLDREASGLDVQEVVGIGHGGAGNFRAGSGHQNRVGINIGGGSAGGHLVGVMEEHIGDSSPDALQGEEGAAPVGYQERGGDRGGRWIDSGYFEGPLSGTTQDHAGRDDERTSGEVAGHAEDDGAAGRAGGVD